MSTAPPVLSPNFDSVSASGIAEETVDNFELLSSQFKKGWRTSEFWLAVGTVATVVGNGVFDLGIDSESLLAMVGTGASYILGRSYLKRFRATTLGYAANF